MLETSAGLVVPLYLLKLEKNTNLDWHKEWYGKEYALSWLLFAPVPNNFVPELMRSFFKESNTRMAWKTGFVNKEGNCDVLVDYSDSKSKSCQFCNYLTLRCKSFFSIKFFFIPVKLSVRTIDPEKIFNLDTNNMHAKFAEFIFMEYKLHIEFLLDKRNIPFQEPNFDLHPIRDKLSVDKIDREKVLSFDRNFYLKEITPTHHISNDRCEDCGRLTVDLLQLNRMATSIYPNFDNSSLKEYDRTQNITKSYECFMMNTYKIKFIEPSYEAYKFRLELVM